jgi:hypothetical protein
MNCFSRNVRLAGCRRRLNSLGALAALLLLAGCDQPAQPPPPTPAPGSAAVPSPAGAATSQTTSAPTTPAEFAKLIGRWLRPDGGYVLEFKSVAPDGKLSASYQNPNPINVSQAEVRKEAGALKVFVELRDVNYPGCTYKLTYDPEHDVLAGEYFQAAQGQTYEVGFERLKPGQP